MTPFLFSPFNMIRLFSLTPVTTQKTEKPIRGSLQVSSTNESGVRALAFLHTQVLLGTWTVGKAMGRPFYVQTKGQLFPTCVSYAGYAHQREESPASALPYCFSVFCFWVLHCLLSIIGRFQKEERRKVEFPDVSSFLCPSPYRGCGGWQFRNRIHHLMRSFHPSDTNIAEGSIFRPPGRKYFQKFSRTYPQGSAQLLSGEGACVTFYAVRPMEWGSMAVGDFSTPLRCARNDSSTRAVVL